MLIKNVKAKTLRQLLAFNQPQHGLV